MTGYFSKYVPCCQECNVAKQIVGSKLWIGYAQKFNFPGFKDNFSGWYGGGTGTWANGGNFGVGDLATREVESQSGGGITYPAYYYVYICIAAVSGSTADPATDTTHFQSWNYDVTGAGASPGGPSGWPTALGIGARQVWTSSTDTAYFELTVTTEFDNCPSIGPDGYPYTDIYGDHLYYGWNDTGQNAFTKACEHAGSANSPFVYAWTLPARYDGTAATFTGPSNAPDSDESLLLFPALPLTPVMYNGGDTLQQLQTRGLDLPRLVSLTGSDTELTFVFAIWINDYIGPGYTAVYGAPATVTQRLQLGGSTYTLGEVAGDAATLRDSTAAGAATFSSIAWGTSWTNTWNAGGGVVATQNFAFSVENAITCACKVGTEIAWAAAVNGLQTSGVTSCYCSKAQVNVCGNYCTRTYNCPTVTCVSGSAGSTPTAVEIDAPGSPGESTGVYANCSCT